MTANTASFDRLPMYVFWIYVCLSIDAVAPEIHIFDLTINITIYFDAVSS